MPFNKKRIPADLLSAYKEDRVAVLVGAGASAASGLPLWGALIDRMATEAKDNRYITAQRATEYKKLAKSPDKYLMVASSLKEDFGSNFDALVEKIFLRPKHALAPVHTSLAKLKRLQFVITTNYDTLLEKLFRAIDPDVAVCTYIEIGELQRRLARREFFLLKAHGDAAKASSIILTDADYRALLYHRRAYQSLLSSMFTMYSIVFVGASLNDPEIKLLLGFIADSFHPSGGPMHYALMPEGDYTKTEENRWFRDYNVKFVPISKAGNYAEIPQFLSALAASA
ncbi:MAG: SIR2 family protein [Devosia sp.]